MSEPKSTYLGDGLYVQDYGYQLKLWADFVVPTSRNSVFLDDQTLLAFFRYIESARGVTITVTRPQPEEGKPA